jgi:hypothetical protein
MKPLEVWVASEAEWGFSLMPTPEREWWVKRIERLGRGGNPLPRRIAQRLRGTRDYYRVVGPGGFIVVRSGRSRLVVLAFMKRRPEEIVQATLDLEGDIARANEIMRAEAASRRRPRDA